MNLNNRKTAKSMDLNRPSNFMANCCEIVAQLANGMVHFFRILRYAR